MLTSAKDAPPEPGTQPGLRPKGTSARAWWAERGPDPLAVRRPREQLDIRWMGEIRRFKPSAVSRRLPVAAGFCRACVIGGLLERSPTGHVRRPSVPPQSSALEFTRSSELLLTAARESSALCGCALAAMPGRQRRAGSRRAGRAGCGVFVPGRAGLPGVAG